MEVWIIVITFRYNQKLKNQSYEKRTILRTCKSIIWPNNNLKRKWKNLSNSKFGYYISVSHAPQTPYFNGSSTYSNFGYIYNQVEYLYGYAIDFYNIQYYNQGNYDYTTYDQLFTNDTYYYASVKQLINASSINSLYNNIPVNKIVLGKCVSSEVYYSPPAEMGYIVLYSATSTDLTMNNYIKTTSTSTDTDIINWYSSGGIMVWLYRVDQSSTVYDNTQLLSYYNNVKH